MCDECTRHRKNIPSAIVLALGNTVVFVLCCIESAFLSFSFLSVKKRFAGAAFVTQVSVVVVVAFPS